MILVHNLKTTGHEKENFLNVRVLGMIENHVRIRNINMFSDNTSSMCKKPNSKHTHSSVTHYCSNTPIPDKVFITPFRPACSTC